MNEYPANPTAVVANPNTTRVHTSATVTSNGSSVVTGFGATEVTLFINVLAAPTGGSPTLQYTIQEVDPGDESTVTGATATSTLITGTGVQHVSLPSTFGGAVKVSWTVGGSSPSFTQVYATVVAKNSSVKLVDSSGAAVTSANPSSVLLTDGTDTALVSASGALKVDGSATTQPVSGTVTANIGTSGLLALDATLTGGTQQTKITDGTDVADVTAANALKVDGSAVTQPISGSVTANIGTSGSLALDATLTGGTQKAIVRGGAKGATAAADVTSTASGADHQPLDVAIYDASGNQITSFGGGTQYTEDAAAPANPTGTAPVLVRADTPAGVATTDGDWVSQRATNYGAAYVQVVSSTGAFVDTFGGGTQYADGAARGTATGTLAMVDDGVNIQSAAGDSSGRQIVVGAAAGGAAAAGNPVLVGGSDGTNARTVRTATDGTVRVDPTGTTTQPVSGTVTANIGTSGSLALDATLTGGTQQTKITDGTDIADVTAANALKVDGSAVTQPISGSVTANIGTSGSLALDATLTGGTQKAIIRGGAKGSTAAADVTSTASGADHQPLDVAIYDASGNQITSFGGGTQYTEDAAAPANPIGTAPVLVRADTPGAIATTDGDWVAQRATNYGAAYTQIVTSAGAFVDSFGGGTQYADGAARGTATGTIAMVDDGANIQSAAGDSSGRQIMVGAAADGAAVAGNPLLIGGSDGANVRIVNVDSNGALRVQSGGTPGAAVPSRALQVAGSDGTNLRTIKTATDGSTVVVGAAATGAAASGNPVQLAGKDVSGNIQVPQVDNILGQTVKQMSTASTITSPLASVAGLYAQVTAAGALRVASEATTQFSDPFDGASIDTTNRWTTSTGTGGTVTQGSGSLVVSGSTSASSFGKIVSIPTFLPIGGSFEVFACAVTFGGTASGTYRFVGVGTSPTTPTTASPLTDAIGFEYDTAGNLYAVVYSGGSNTYRSSALTAPGTTRHTCYMLIRADTVLFYWDTIEVPVASATVTPSTQALPILLESVVGGAGVGSAPTITAISLAMLDTGGHGVFIADPTYAWRKATVKPASTAAATTDTAMVVALHPSTTPFKFGDDNRLKVGQEEFNLFDTFEGAAVNTVVWAQPQSGMTQAVSGGAVTLNSGSSTTTGNYSILTSTKSVRYSEEFGLHVQFRARLVIGSSNTVIELGWGSVATTAAPTNGVFFRVTSAGVLQGVINFGGSETTTTLLAAGFTNTNYFDLKLRILENVVEFEVQSNDGTTVNVLTRLTLPLTQASMVTADTQPVFMRVYNSGAAGSAAQIICADTGCTTMDSGPVLADTTNTTSVASSATTVTLLAANPNRRGAVIFNDSNQTLYVKLGATASTTSFAYKVTAGGTLELATLVDGRPYVGIVDGIWSSANGNARITEIF